MRKIIALPAAVFATLTLAAGLAGTASAVTVPTLGRAGIFYNHGTGFGTVKPRVVDNGGDPTGRVDHIKWRNWGKPYATGTGIGLWVGPNQIVADGHRQRAHIVAFNLGTCHGRWRYRAVEWYFPQHGQRWDPRTYENICSGTYVINGHTSLSGTLQEERS